MARPRKNWPRQHRVHGPGPIETAPSTPRVPRDMAPRHLMGGRDGVADRRNQIAAEMRKAEKRTQKFSRTRSDKGVVFSAKVS